MNEETIKLLARLNLNPKAIEVYLANLELGATTVGQVAEKSGVNRTTIYHLLEELKSAGLVNELESGHGNLLVPESPEHLAELANKYVQQSKNFAGEVAEIIPELMSIFNLPAKKPKIKFYDGIDGLKKIYEDTLKGDHHTIYAFSDYEKMFAAMEHDYLMGYAKKRADCGISISCISPPGEWAQKMTDLRESQNRKIKIVPKVKFDTEINIYGDKVALISFVRPPMGVIIENRAIAQTLRSVWKAWWETLK